jgi:rod shape-determining protein MreC
VTQFRPYKKRESRLLIVTLLLIALLLLFTAPFYFRPLAASVFYPFQMVSSLLWKGVVSTPAFVFNLGNLSRENKELKGEVAALSARLSTYAELEQENKRLRAALNFKTIHSYGGKLLPAKVIARGPSPLFSTLQVDQGSRSGVHLNMPVIVPEGLVGKVIEVAPYSAKVLLLFDAESRVAAVDARSRDFGVVEGGYPGKLRLQYVDSGATLKEGDAVVTAQISSVFPPGIPLGTITKFKKSEQDLFYYIEVKPAANFSKIEEVFIII